MLHPIQPMARPRARHAAPSARAARAPWLAAACIAAVTNLSGCADIDDRQATWSYVYPAIIAPSCATSNCHSYVAATAGLQFHTKEAAYTFLTGRVCEPSDAPGQPSHNFVVPSQPESSKLMYLLRGQEVRQMPPDAPLADTEIELIEQWILEGAACN